MTIGMFVASGAGQCGGNIASGVAPLGDGYAFEPLPAGRCQQFGRDFFCGVSRCLWLPPRRLDQQSRVGPICLEIHACSNPITHKHRQGVVAVPALLRRGVDLDALVEIEDAGGTLAEPDHGVERGEKCGAFDAARKDSVAVQPHRQRRSVLLPSGYADGKKLPRIN